ncbi:FkbM family methyltransferase [Streptomyces sparsogenes]|uniref:FkbM family methyltransferase n=1 Tax=Streptomyces sparsogenes TaxID=67365 RepID=UPI0033E8A7BE
MRSYRLDDGRRVWCTSPAEAGSLWREMTAEDGYYRQAATRLRPGDTVLDVGANIGLASLAFAGAQPAARITAVEPVPALFDCLERNLADQVPGARALRVAVGAAPGRASMVYYPGAPANSSLYADREADDRLSRTFLRNSGIDEESAEVIVGDLHANGETIEVEVTTVSEVLRSNGLAEVALLKIDVERAERDVLAGIEPGDWPRIGSIVAEVDDGAPGGLDAFCKQLHAQGFTTRVRQDETLRGTDIHEVDAVREA